MSTTQSKVIPVQTPRTLIADDQPDILAALGLLLKGEGYQTEAVTSPAAVLEAIQSKCYDVVLMDLNYARDTTSGQEGLDLLTRIHAIDNTLPVVVMTAWGTVELAVEAMRRGVGDFVQKPWENERLLNILRTQIELGHTLRKGQRLEEEKKQIARSLLEAPDIDSMLQLVSEHLHRVLQSSTVAFFTRGPREYAYRIMAKAAIADEIAGQIRFEPGNWLLSMIDSIFDPRERELPDEEKSKLDILRSALIVPVRLREELIGFISLGDKPEEQVYDAEEMKFLSGVVEQIGAGLNNLRLRGQERELEEAREIQQGLLPKRLPNIEGYEISDAWRPARTVGGDYFDVLKFNESSMAVCIADVVGKGVPAALLMSNAQAVVKAFASESVMPQDLCERVNRLMCGNIAADKFITFFYGLLDAKNKKFIYANAGHNAPVLVRKDGTSIRLKEGGAVLGVFPSWKYLQGEVKLMSGDRIVLFTDGVTEVRNSEGEEFGEERLISLTVENIELSASDLQEKILDAVTRYSGGNFQDDVTLMVLSVGS